MHISQCNQSKSILTSTFYGSGGNDNSHNKVLGIEVHNMSKGTSLHIGMNIPVLRKPFARFSVFINTFFLKYICCWSVMLILILIYSAQQKKNLPSQPLNDCDVVHFLTSIKDAIF